MLPTLTRILTPLMSFLLRATLTQRLSISRLNHVITANTAFSWQKGASPRRPLPTTANVVRIPPVGVNLISPFPSTTHTSAALRKSFLFVLLLFGAYFLEDNSLLLQQASFFTAFRTVLNKSAENPLIELKPWPKMPKLQTSELKLDLHAYELYLHKLAKANDPNKVTVESTNAFTDTPLFRQYIADCKTSDAFYATLPFPKKPELLPQMERPTRDSCEEHHLAFDSTEVRRIWQFIADRRSERFSVRLSDVIAMEEYRLWYDRFQPNNNCSPYDHPAYVVPHALLRRACRLEVQAIPPKNVNHLYGNIWRVSNPVLPNPTVSASVYTSSAPSPNVYTPAVSASSSVGPRPHTPADSSPESVGSFSGSDSGSEEIPPQFSKLSPETMAAFETEPIYRDYILRRDADADAQIPDPTKPHWQPVRLLFPVPAENAPCEWHATYDIVAVQSAFTRVANTRTTHFPAATWGFVKDEVYRLLKVRQKAFAADKSEAHFNYVMPEHLLAELLSEEAENTRLYNSAGGSSAVVEAVLDGTINSTSDSGMPMAIFWRSASLTFTFYRMGGFGYYWLNVLTALSKFRSYFTPTEAPETRTLASFAACPPSPKTSPLLLISAPLCEPTRVNAGTNSANSLTFISNPRTPGAPRATGPPVLVQQTGTRH